MSEPDAMLKDAKNKMEKTIESLQNTMSQIRSGRASTAIVDDIKVDVYGQSMPMNQLATISVPEARQITIDLWDKGNLQAAEKAISASGRNLNPNTDGGVIRINLPDLTEENRKDLAKLAKQKLEDHKVAVRNIRRDINDALKKKKDELSEDSLRGHQDQVQKLTDEIIQKMDEIQRVKEQEIMNI